jgi:hypothetical protein
MERAYVMDEECYVERMETAGGSMREVPVYFAPLIRRGNLEKPPGFVANLDEIIVLNASPLERVIATEAPVTIRPVLASSPRAWREIDMRAVDHAPMRPPPPRERQSQQIIAYLLEGPFSSYFAGGPLPSPPEEKGRDFQQQPVFVPESRGGRIFVIGTSSVLGADLLNASGVGPNSQFVLNLIDAMSGREELAELRSKGPMMSHLRETTAPERLRAKTLNIVGLPLLTVLAGMLVWLARSARRKRIRDAFLGKARRKR